MLVDTAYSVLVTPVANLAVTCREFCCWWVHESQLYPWLIHSYAYYLINPDVSGLVSDLASMFMKFPLYSIRKASSLMMSVSCYLGEGHAYECVS